MAKKTFKGNPALQFISETEEEKSEQVETLTENAGTDAETTAPKGYHKNPLFVENKTKRLQLVLQPSLLERVRAEAKANGLSVNEYCHQILDKATRKE